MAFPNAEKDISCPVPAGSVAGFAYLAPKPVTEDHGYAETKGVVA